MEYFLMLIFHLFVLAPLSPLTHKSHTHRSALFQDVGDLLVDALSNALSQFRDLIVNLGLGTLYEATLLIDLKRSEESRVVEEMIKNHLATMRTEKASDKASHDAVRRAEVWEEALLQVCI